MTEAVAESVDDDAVIDQFEVEPEDDEIVESDAAEAADREPDEVVIAIGEESPPSEDEEASQAPQWVKDLRKDHRDLQRRNRELEQKLKTPTTPEAAVVVGPKPTFAAANYDEEQYERDLEAWNSRRRANEDKQRSEQEKTQKAQDAYQAKLNDHRKLKGALKVKDADDAEAVALDSLSTVQQGLIVQGADNSAMVIYALGKNPAKLKELAAEQDPVKFAFKVAKLETQLKVVPKKTAPLPEQPVRGNAAVTSSADATLERLRKEADKTGDRSKVSAYMRKKRNDRK